VPFNQRFADVTQFQKTVFFATLLCTAASTICLIAPTAHHRIEFRQQDKRRIVQTGNRIVILGLLLLAIAMTGAVMFVTDFLYASTTTTVVAAATGAAFLLFWYAIPLRRLAQSD
jgi:Flp pilus assembly protein TadB